MPTISATAIIAGNLCEREAPLVGASWSRPGSTVSAVGEFAGLIVGNGISEKSAVPAKR